MTPINTDYLEHVRIKAGLRQRDVAANAHISMSHYAKVEGGFAGMSMELLMNIDAALDHQLDFNLLLKQKRPPAESPASGRGESI